MREEREKTRYKKQHTLPSSGILTIIHEVIPHEFMNSISGARSLYIQYLFETCKGYIYSFNSDIVRDT
jgi:hypothetical protein